MGRSSGGWLRFGGVWTFTDPVMILVRTRRLNTSRIAVLAPMANSRVIEAQGTVSMRRGPIRQPQASNGGGSRTPLPRCPLVRTVHGLAYLDAALHPGEDDDSLASSASESPHRSQGLHSDDNSAIAPRRAVEEFAV